MSAQRKEQTEILPIDLGRMALEATDDCMAKATDWAFDWLKQNPAWAANYAEDMARKWAEAQVGYALKVARRKIGQASTSPSPVVVPFQSQMTAAIEANYSRMIDAPIWGGKKIGDATPQEIRESADQYHKQGSNMIRKSAWQIAIAEAAEKNGAGINEPVRKVLAPKTFEQLWEETDAA